MTLPTEPGVRSPAGTGVLSRPTACPAKKKWKILQVFWDSILVYMIQLKYTIEGVRKILVPQDQIYFLRRSQGK